MRLLRLFRVIISSLFLPFAKHRDVCVPTPPPLPTRCHPRGHTDRAGSGVFVVVVVRDKHVKNTRAFSFSLAGLTSGEREGRKRKERERGAGRRETAWPMLRGWKEKGWRNERERSEKKNGWKRATSRRITVRGGFRRETEGETRVVFVEWRVVYRSIRTLSVGEFSFPFLFLFFF